MIAKHPHTLRDPWQPDRLYLKRLEAAASPAMNRTDGHPAGPISATWRRHSLTLPAFLLAMTCLPVRAHASLFHGETLDAIANGISWVAIIVGPIIGIVIFWLVHILPEKIAEKKKHPQTHAIQCVCLLSLVFGGLLWPFAWLWAYTKPVGYKLAYGTDVDETLGHGHGEKEEDKEVKEEKEKKKGGKA